MNEYLQTAQTMNSIMDEEMSASVVSTSAGQERQTLIFHALKGQHFVKTTALEVSTKYWVAVDLTVYMLARNEHDCLTY